MGGIVMYGSKYLHCRRCGCVRLIKLEKMRREDNDVYRCRE